MDVPFGQPGQARARLDSAVKVEVERGSFHLGGAAPPATEAGAGQVLYDARDLTTHGVIVGMTGSGKTGLGVVLLEEALLSGIPTLVIDPKGDMGNLLLNFPDLSPEDFRPWINESVAVRKGMSVEEYAATTATDWREGLASWGTGPERMRELRDLEIGLEASDVQVDEIALVWVPTA